MTLRKNVGAPNGPSRSAPFNRWLRYPAGFGPDAARVALEWCDPQPGDRALDPFAGAATLAPWLSGRGVEFVGVEANPLIAEFAGLKAGPWPSPEDLRRAADDLIGRMAPDSADLSKEHDLVTSCFKPATLRQLVSMRNQLDKADDAVAPWLRLVLISTLREVASAAVGWPYQRPAKTRKPSYANAVERFSERVDWVCADIASLQVRVPGTVFAGDARSPSLSSKLPDGWRASLCVTSPPYLNNYDYADATRLELFFLGLADSWASMVKYARSRMLVASTQQTAKGAAEADLSHLEGQQCFAELSSLYVALQSARMSRPRGKEYDRLLVQYFAGMARVFVQLRDVVQAQGKLCLVVGDSAPYGVHVDTPRLLSELAHDCGFVLEKSVDVRRRGHRWPSNSQRDQIDLHETVVLMTRRDAAST